jgi:hypothetical protein
MKIFYKVSDKQLLKDKNDIFKEIGVLALKKNGFVLSPFKTSWNGQFNKSINGYIYALCRLKDRKYLEIIDVYISSEDRWIKIYLNIFELSPELKLLNELSENEGTKFGTSPNNLTRMRIRSDDYKGPPLFYMLFLPEHKIVNFYTKSGYENSLKKLKNLIQSDMENIENFVKRWHELHKPSLTDWEGNLPLANSM